MLLYKQLFVAYELKGNCLLHVIQNSWWTNARLEGSQFATWVCKDDHCHLFKLFIAYFQALMAEILMQNRVCLALPQLQELLSSSYQIQIKSYLSCEASLQSMGYKNSMWLLSQLSSSTWCCTLKGQTKISREKIRTWKLQCKLFSYKKKHNKYCYIFIQKC